MSIPPRGRSDPADAALARLRDDGHEVASEDAARLSPLVDAHVNLLGRYAFTQPPGTGLRPLRDPNEPSEVPDAPAREPQS